MRTVVAAILRIEFILQSSFKFTAVLSTRYRVPLYPLPPHMQSFPCYQHLHVQSGTCVETNEPTFTHHYYPESIVCIRVQYCAFYGLGQMCVNMCLPLWCHKRSFTALKFFHVASSLGSLNWVMKENYIKDAQHIMLHLFSSRVSLQKI